MGGTKHFEREEFFLTLILKADCADQLFQLAEENAVDQYYVIILGCVLCFHCPLVEGTMLEEQVSFPCDFLFFKTYFKA